LGDGSNGTGMVLEREGGVKGEKGYVGRLKTGRNCLWVRSLRGKRVTKVEKTVRLMVHTLVQGSAKKPRTWGGEG